MLMVGVMSGVVVAPIFLVFNVAFCVGSLMVRRLPRPVRGVEGPPRFSVPVGSDERAAKRIWFTVRYREMVLAAFPGVLAALRGDSDTAARTGLVGWGALLAIFALPTDSVLVLLPLFFAYYWSFTRQLAARYAADADERAIRCMREMDEAMTRAECELPSCPRCRLAERTRDGWCGACRMTLAAGELSLEDWRARVGNRLQLEQDGALFARCADKMTRSYFGIGGETYVLNPAARASGKPVAVDPEVTDGPRHEQVVEQAYRDPRRPDLVWVRVRESLSYAAAGAHANVRVEAWGFVDGRFAQAWVFAPLSVGTLAA
ncbi:MAG: hypothetical protein J7513_05230 [Solirubrobacteraceae bacterium]|nr:hypothetical protein [Solirubrobacteraceae bacterium]